MFTEQSRIAAEVRESLAAFALAIKEGRDPASAVDATANSIFKFTNCAARLAHRGPVDLGMTAEEGRRDATLTLHRYPRQPDTNATYPPRNGWALDVADGAARFRGPVCFEGPIDAVDGIALPIGAVILWAGAFADIPAGWVIMDGTANASGSGIDMRGTLAYGSDATGSDIGDSITALVTGTISAHAATGGGPATVTVSAHAQSGAGTQTVVVSAHAESGAGTQVVSIGSTGDPITITVATAAAGMTFNSINTTGAGAALTSGPAFTSVDTDSHGHTGSTVSSSNVAAELQGVIGNSLIAAALATHTATITNANIASGLATHTASITHAAIVAAIDTHTFTGGTVRPAGKIIAYIERIS